MHREKGIDAVCLWSSLFCSSKRGAQRQEQEEPVISYPWGMKDTGEKTERKRDFGLL